MATDNDGAIDSERLQELEAFVADMAEAASTIETLGRTLAAQISEQITGLANAYAAQIRDRAEALSRNARDGRPKPIN